METDALCPYCGKKFAVAFYTEDIGPEKVKVIHCSECNKVIGFVKID